ncbi:MAG: MFS transporter [Spongiibacteraceae bacterium]|nr:MFS transporter [Spongiibacteraceae bacterium]
MTRQSNKKTPQQIIAESPLSRVQIVAIFICIMLTALDGFDVLSISFASPGIASEWGINRAALGIVLSMELIGMAIGSIVLGNLADRIGRRPLVLACLIIMSGGMLLAGFANDVMSLSIYRFLTGIGIGGMLAATNAMTAEHSNTRRRNMAVILMSAGFPLGAIIGGSISTVLLQSFDWRSVFIFGGLVTAGFIPFVWFLLPETVSFLAKKRSSRSLTKINSILKRMGHATVETLGEQEPETTRVGIAKLFTPALARITLLLTAAYFAHIMTFYFILKWIPKIVVDMGYAASTAGSVLVWANVGSLIGALLLGFLSQRFSVRLLVMGALVFAVVMVNVFGLGYETIQQLALIAAVVGFFTNSAVVGLYAILAQSFPTQVRASGTGFVIGVGRGGSAAGPIIAGYLFAMGQGLQTVAFVMALGSLVAAVMLFLLPKEKKD